MTTTKERPVTIEYSPENAEQLNSIATWVGRARLASQICFEQSRNAETQDVQKFLEIHGHPDVNRPRVSRALNALRKEHDIKTTGEIPAMTDEKIEELERDFNRGEGVQAEMAGLHDIAELNGWKVNGSTSTTQEAPIPAPRGDRESTAPVNVTPDREAPATEPKTTWERFCAGVRSLNLWVIDKFQTFVYLALLTVAAYGLYEVLYQLAGVPQLVAIVGAVGMELVGISLKLAADGAERSKEKRLVVWALLAASGVVAVGVAAVNWWGHAELDGPIVALAFAAASIVGYSLWTIKSLIAHRAELREEGRLDGPGAHIPGYVRDRYGKDVHERARKITTWNSTVSVHEAVDRARNELAEEARETRQKENQEALRKALIEQARETHSSQLAADLEVARFGVDALADHVEASKDETAAKAQELTSWVLSQQKQN